MSRPKRLANHSYLGRAVYFLTFCVCDRHQVFKDATVAAETLARFQRTAREESFELLAYCLMPDHVHLLVKGLDEKSDLRRFVKVSKERSGRAFRKRCGERLWQEGYYDRVLRDDTDVRRYAEYIVNNPVRAGLVATPSEYEHVGPSRLMNVGPERQARPTLSRNRSGTV